MLKGWLGTVEKQIRQLSERSEPQSQSGDPAEEELFAYQPPPQPRLLPKISIQFG